MAFFLLCEITYTLTLWSSKMFVFSRPLILSTEKRIRIAGLRVEGSPTRKKKQRSKQTQFVKKIAKDKYTCIQELTQINTSEKENKYTGSKEKYSS